MLNIIKLFETVKCIENPDSGTISQEVIAYFRCAENAKKIANKNTSFASFGQVNNVDAIYDAETKTYYKITKIKIGL